MSYFGTQGPPQDSGFIGGIARGQARLRNAQANRARYSKGLGARRLIDFDAYRFIPGASDFPDDEVLYQRAQNVVDSRDRSRFADADFEQNRINEDQYNVLINQYEKDKQLIAEWAESGPYVHETKAFAMGTAPFLVAGLLYLGYTTFVMRPRPIPKASKNAFSAVFS